MSSCFVDALKKNELYVGVLTNFDCNLKCKNCINCSPLYNQKNLNFPEIDFEKTCKSLEYIRKLGFKIVNLTGGEPLLYPKIFDLIRFCKSLGFFVTANTNGLLIPKIKFPDDILNLLKSNEFCFIVSMKGKYFDNSKAIDFLERNNLAYEIATVGNYEFRDLKLLKKKHEIKPIFKCYFFLPEILNDKIYFCSLALRKEIFNLDYIENDLVFDYDHFKSIKDIKNAAMKKYKLCQNCTYFSNVKTEEISKSSLKIEEFVEV